MEPAHRVRRRRRENQNRPNPMLALREALLGRRHYKEYRLDCYRFSSSLTTSDTQACLKNLNSVSFNVKFQIRYPNGSPHDETCIMTAQSSRILPNFNEDCDLTILNAFPTEVPFIVGKLADAPESADICTFSVGDDAIFVDHNLLNGLPDFNLRLLLDETRSCVIEDVEFSMFAIFFQIIFKFLSLSDFYEMFEITNLCCVFSTANNTTALLWEDNFRIEYNVINNTKKHMQLFEHLGLNWKFYISIDRINKIEYLGIGVIIEPRGISNMSYFEQIAEIEVTVRNDDSSFQKQIILSRNFNHNQSSAGCPVILRKDEINLEQDDNLIFDIRVSNKLNEVTEFCGEKNITLVIENQKIVTSKNLLIHHFDYFKTLFESNFDDKDQEELVLHDVKYKDMYNIFDVIYNRSKSLAVNELKAMLILADRFFCPYIIQYVDIAIADIRYTGPSFVPVVVTLDEKKYFAENYHQLVRVKECVKRATHPSVQTRS